MITKPIEMAVDVPTEFTKKQGFEGMFIQFNHLIPYYSSTKPFNVSVLIKVLDSKVFLKDKGRIKAKVFGEEIDYLIDWIKDNPNKVKKIMGE